MPQYDFLYDNYGNLLVDFVGKFENLQNDFNIICSKIGIDCTPLPHLNLAVSNKSIIDKIKDIALINKDKKIKEYSLYYDEELKEILPNQYAKDISTFDYVFS